MTRESTCKRKRTVFSFNKIRLRPEVGHSRNVAALRKFYSTKWQKMAIPNMGLDIGIEPQTWQNPYITKKELQKLLWRKKLHASYIPMKGYAQRPSSTHPPWEKCWNNNKTHELTAGVAELPRYPSQSWRGNLQVSRTLGSPWSIYHRDLKEQLAF